jgi:hypothetical protein
MMTVNEIKDFFRKIRKEQNEIAHLSAMIKNEELALLPKAIVYDKDKVQVSPDDKFSEVCAKISDMQEELGMSIMRLKEKQIRAELMIRNLEDPDEREVLRWYYLTLYENRPLTWQQVAIRMNYYRRHVIRIHGNALQHLAEDGTQ